MIQIDELRARGYRLLALAGSMLLLVTCGLPGCQSVPPLTLVEQGEAAYTRGAYREADELFEQALAESPADGRALHGRARVALARRNPEAALRFYGKLSKVDRPYFTSATRDDYALTLLEAGRARLAKGKPAAALEVLRVLQRVKPQQEGLTRVLSSALTSRGQQLAMHGRRDEAMAHFKRAIGLAPGSTAAYVGAAEILIATGRKQEALSLLTVARRHDPSDNRVRALTVEAMGLY